MAPSGARFRHEALLYQGPEAFVAHVSGFVRAGVDAGEPVLVAVPREHAGWLREELGGRAAGVEFLAAGELGRNPARSIPAWLDWVERHRGAGRFRGVSELGATGQDPARDHACRVHEHLLNAAFSAGPGWALLCPYDLDRLPPEMLDGVARSHQVFSGTPLPPGAPAFDPLGALTAFEEPLPELGRPLFEAAFGLEDLPELRSAIRSRAAELGLHGARLADFVLVADELACNSVRHGGGDGRLALWATDGSAVCEVSDKGLIVDPLVGRRHPDLGGQGPGAGLWSANQICDLVLIRSAPAEGTAVRAYLDVR